MVQIIAMISPMSVFGEAGFATVALFFSPTSSWLMFLTWSFFFHATTQTFCYDVSGEVSSEFTIEF
jgi:hypothetical protein